MHFEILVEGQADRTALEPLLNKIVGAFRQPHTWRIHKHRGIGRLPDNKASRPNPKDHSLLHNLPAKLRAYGKSLQSSEMVVVLLDLDDRPDCRAFKKDIIELLDFCNPKPTCLVRIAIEEIEAWYLGDKNALIQAYPNAIQAQLNNYVQDSQTGTWEKLADIVYPGGYSNLRKLGRSRCLEQKRIWARDIVPNMDVDNNASPSFQCFRDGIRRFASS